MKNDFPFPKQAKSRTAKAFERSEGASAPCREGGAMRRPGGTRWSEAESACPPGDRCEAARGKTYLHQKSRSFDRLFWWRWADFNPFYTFIIIN